MSTRDRKPLPKRDLHITPEGAKTLRDELDFLWTKERPRVTQEVADAAAQGDRSENAEYIYGKKRLREIDRRVRFLSKRLDEVIIVKEPPTDPSKAYFGAYVTVEDEEGDEKTYRIVGPDESDMEKGFISIDSPVARALLGKRDGDDVRVTVPKGVIEYTVVGVEYRKVVNDRVTAPEPSSPEPARPEPSRSRAEPARAPERPRGRGSR